MLKTTCITPVLKLLYFKVSQENTLIYQNCVFLEAECMLENLVTVQPNWIIMQPKVYFFVLAQRIMMCILLMMPLGKFGWDNMSFLMKLICLFQRGKHHLPLKRSNGLDTIKEYRVSNEKTKDQEQKLQTSLQICCITPTAKMPFIRICWI